MRADIRLLRLIKRRVRKMRRRHAINYIPDRYQVSPHWAFTEVEKMLNAEIDRRCMRR